LRAFNSVDRRADLAILPRPAARAASFGGFLGKKGAITPADTVAYYNAIGAPSTLASFKSSFGFPTGEVTATYYNDGDLGLVREMHCRALGGGAGPSRATSPTTPGSPARRCSTRIPPSCSPTPSRGSTRSPPSR
jgi:hypothetical protein